ncbi:HPP family protein, partial [Pseudomonas sp.]|uniref:HPP family protein n=1 Tax=Pseudomonas sp. TaxID=306 RepID=UPI0025901759
MALVAPLGASAVLVFALPSSPLAQPWSVVGGNTLSALIGIACALWIPEANLAAAVAVALAIAAMFTLRCLHPPGGASALLMVLIGAQDFSYAWSPVALDSLLLVSAGLLYNNLTRRPWPHVPRPAEPSGETRLQRADQGHDNYLRVGQPDCVGRVIVGMSNDAFNQRQQEILLKAAVLALFALLFSFLLARRLALSLARPISQMGLAVKAIQEGDFKAPLPIVDDAELGSLAQHINNLATGLEKAGREQRQTIEQLVSTREQAERANSAKSDFLAMMSHELRTPMNGVLGMLQLLETTVMTEEQHEYAALATQSTEHLLKVINDILDFSRIERAALELEHIPFNLGELVASCAQAFQHNASARNLSLNLNLPPGIDHLQVEGDPTRIRQILVNLIGNAIKFTEVGSVQIDAHWQVLDHQLIWLTCTVRDTGIGISAERLESMFVAFQQADSSISRRYGGTGLGLPIARTLAERMGGTLQAESREGNGSLFTLEIPLALSQRSVAPLREPRLGEEAHGVGKRVLLVEDNPVNQTVIEAMLRSLGCVVCVVGDGAQAIHEVGQQPFDAVLMDCRLPIVDGYEATRRIRQLPEHAQLPIIALTANALLGDR